MIIIIFRHKISNQVLACHQIHQLNPSELWKQDIRSLYQLFIRSQITFQDPLPILCAGVF